MEQALFSPCLVCRRRMRWHGKPLFTTCTCINHGRGVTVAAIAGGVAAALLAAGWLLSRSGRSPERQKEHE